MFGRHKHVFKVVKSTFTPPASGSVKVTNADDLTLQQIVMGVTNILYRCECGKETVNTVVGRFE